MSCKIRSNALLRYRRTPFSNGHLMPTVSNKATDIDIQPNGRNLERREYLKVDCVLLPLDSRRRNAGFTDRKRIYDFLIYGQIVSVGY